MASIRIKHFNITRSEIILALGILALGIIVLNLEKPISSEIVKEHKSSSSMTKIVITDYDAGGLVKNYVSADKMDEHDNNIQAINPIIKIKTSDQKPWVIRANKALTTSNFNKIKLRNNVNILIEDQNKTTAIETQSLDYDRITNIAKTSEHVTLKQNNLTLESDGLVANIDSRVFDLTSNTSGIYNE